MFVWAWGEEGGGREAVQACRHLPIRHARAGLGFAIVPSCFSDYPSCLLSSLCFRCVHTCSHNNPPPTQPTPTTTNAHQRVFR